MPVQNPLDVWQEVDVEWKLRLELCCIDMFAMEAVGHPLRQVDHSHWLIRKGLSIINNEIAAVGAFVVHKEHQVPIVLACAALWISGTDCAQCQLAAPLTAELARN